jgi:hypothetical protein
MRRIWAYVIAFVFMLVGVRVVLLAVAPLVPVAIVGLVAASVLGRLYYRRW